MAAVATPKLVSALEGYRASTGFAATANTLTSQEEADQLVAAMSGLTAIPWAGLLRLALMILPYVVKDPAQRAVYEAILQALAEIFKV